ncbi:MAG: alpha/beta hydrolase [Gordonia paraffinivorans]
MAWTRRGCISSDCPSAGVVVQAVAAREPRAIRTLTLIDTGAHFTAPARAAMIDRAADIRRDGLTDGVLDGLLTHWFRPATLDVRPHLVDRARKTLSLLDDTVHAALWEMIAAVDERERLVDIVAPTTVVVGEHDTSSPVATAAELVSGIAGSTLHVVPGAAHLSPVECPAAVTTIIRSAVAAGAAHR